MQTDHSENIAGGEAVCLPRFAHRGSGCRRRFGVGGPSFALSSRSFDSFTDFTFRSLVFTQPWRPGFDDSCGESVTIGNFSIKGLMWSRSEERSVNDQRQSIPQAVYGIENTEGVSINTGGSGK